MVEQDNSTNHSIIQGFSFQLDRRVQSVRKGTEKESDSGTKGAMQTRSIDAGRLETGDKE
jgi:hypothetical protein